MKQAFLNNRRNAIGYHCHHQRDTVFGPNFGDPGPGPDTEHRAVGFTTDSSVDRETLFVEKSDVTIDTPHGK